MESLRVFVELAQKIEAAEKQGTRYASLSEAAEGMSSSYSKSNVFRALEELRKVYGRQLVNRSTVMLTKEGEAVLSWAKALLEHHAKGTKWPIGAKEEIHIGTTNWILTFLLPEVLTAYAKDRAKRKRKAPDLPEVNISFGEYDVEQLLVDLRKGVVHAGLAAVFAAGPWPDLEVETVREKVETVMIASSDDERWGSDARRRRKDVSLSEFAGEIQCVIKPDLETVLAGIPEPVPPGSRIVVESYASVVALVRARVAIGFIPGLGRGDEAEHSAYQGLEVYSIREAPPHRTFSVLRRSGEELSGEVEAFLRVVKERLS
jgi:DNA-binding transcriptional LysR family regulator